MNRTTLLLALLTLAAACATGRVSARPVSAERAFRGAEAWAARLPNVRRAPSGRAETVSLDGTNLFHLVALEGGGFVALSTDDALPPVMGFSPSGDLPDLDAGGPLWALLGGDAAKAHGLPPRAVLRRAGAAHRARATFAARARRGNRPSRSARTKAAPARRPLTWAALEEEAVEEAAEDEAATAAASPAKTRLTAASSYVTSATGLDDIRVSPLIQSTWDQSTVGGKKVYNYYTPEGMVCGCVATAMAQLMRYHQYPASPATKGPFICYTNGVPVTLTLKGGTYVWANMPLTPSSSITDDEREAIGRICYDAGVAMRMQYTSTSGGSGAIGQGIFKILKDVFRYANAHCYELTDDDAFNTDVQDGILANLDAGYPVLLGISGRSGGHAVLADGYGYADGALYCHLNMGWSGNSNFWYMLPTIAPPGFSFSNLECILFNIFPSTRGEVLSGRVTNPYGEAVPNATVTASIRYGSIGRITTNVTTSATGIYAILPPSRDSTTTLSAAYPVCAWASASATTNTTASVSPINLQFVDGATSASANIYANNWETSVGNSWGNDLVVGPTNIAVAAVSSFAPAAADDANAVALGFAGTAAAWYQVEWTDRLTNETWNVYTNILLGTDGAALLAIPRAADLDSCFYRIRTNPNP